MTLHRTPWIVHEQVFFVNSYSNNPSTSTSNRMLLSVNGATLLARVGVALWISLRGS